MSALARSIAVFVIVLIMCGVSGLTGQTRQKTINLPPSQRADKPIVITSTDDLQWVVAVPLPPGAQRAIIEGNINLKGPLTEQVKYPSNYKIPPHSHPVNERLTVLQGEVHLGFGDKFDSTKGTTLKVGGFALIPAHTNHYSWTTQATVIQVYTSGPWDLKYVSPGDDPRNATSKSGAGREKK